MSQSQLTNLSPRIELDKRPNGCSIWFNPTACPTSAGLYRSVARSLRDQSDGALLVDLGNLLYGYISIQQNPTIDSPVDLDQAITIMTDRIRETCQNADTRSHAAARLPSDR